MKKNATLLIKIDTKESMDLKETMRYLEVIAKEYDSYCKNELDLDEKDRNLEIIKLEKGSWVLELATDMAVAISAGAIVAFGKYLIGSIKSFSGKEKENSTIQDDARNHTTKSYTNIHDILGPSAINNGTINININDNGKTISTEAFNGTESKEAQNNIMKCIEKQSEEKILKKKISKKKILTKHKQAVLRWASDSFPKPEANEISGKGIIEKLDKKAHNIIFENAADKEKLLELTNVFKEGYWKNLSYKVDVEVAKKQGEIISYKILQVWYAMAIPK